MKVNTIDNILMCGCGSEYLHHYEVDVFIREKEDSLDGMITRVEDLSGKSETFKGNMGIFGNPSSRRNGIILKFFCEDCEDLTWISFAQHKGMTFFDAKVYGGMKKSDLGLT